MKSVREDAVDEEQLRLAGETLVEDVVDVGEPLFPAAAFLAGTGGEVCFRRAVHLQFKKQHRSHSFAAKCSKQKASPRNGRGKAGASLP